MKIKEKITHIYLFGIGAAGSNIFLNLLYIHPELEYILVDFDSVEDRNIIHGTQPYTKADLKRPKTQALQRISLSVKNKKVNALFERVRNVSDIKKIVTNPNQSIIIDAFDNAESRNFFKQLSDEYNVYHIGFSASLTGEGVWNDVFTPMTASKADAEINVCEMAVAKPFIMALTAMASINIENFISEGVKKNFYFDKFLNVKRF